MGNVRPLLNSVACVAFLGCAAKSPPVELPQARTRSVQSADAAPEPVAAAPVAAVPEPIAAAPEPSVKDAALLRPCSATRMGCIGEERPKSNRVNKVAPSAKP